MAQAYKSFFRCFVNLLQADKNLSTSGKFIIGILKKKTSTNCYVWNSIYSYIHVVIHAQFLISLFATRVIQRAGYDSVLATETIYCFFPIRLVFRLFACHWISENLLPQVSKSYCNSIISARCWHTIDNMVRLAMISCDWKSNGSAGDQILSESKLIVQNKNFWIYLISYYNILYFLFLS